MATLVHLKQPGVMVQAEQDEKPNESTEHIVPAAKVRTFEVSGDSVYLADHNPLPATVADMVRRFGPGFVENPDYDDNDGPMLRICSMRNLGFRVALPVGVTAKTWRADTSARNAATRIHSILAMQRSDAGQKYCSRMLDSLPTTR
jgi:hypothetical protein